MMENIAANYVKVGEYKAFLAEPKIEENSQKAAIIILHEIYGLNEDIKRITKQFAEIGYVAIAVDLFSVGNKALCVAKTFRHALINMLESQHLGWLDQVVKYLAQKIDSSRIGVVGFCLGGGYALSLAIHNQDIKACSVFYGLNPKPASRYSTICPVIGSYAERDPFPFLKTHPNAAGKLESILKQHDKPYEIKLYKGTGHSFFNVKSRNYDNLAATDAWERVIKFFKEYI